MKLKATVLLFLFYFFSQQTWALESFDKYFSKSSLGSIQTRESNHFLVRWVHPRDEIIVDALLEHLEAAHALLDPQFNLSLKKKAPVEIFPDLKSFSDVSQLALARFKATGTIALTLEQRLMILSPRNLLGGYSWAVTVVHEYIHYLIREISPDYIPIWLHEGTAQFFQGYPYQTEMHLTPSQWGLFRKAKKKNEWLNLETLKEPFPYRKTAEEAELAYIQSLLFTQWLQKRCGVLNLIRTASNFKSVDKALEQCTGWSNNEMKKKFLEEILPGVAIPDGKDVAFFARDFSGGDALEVESRKADKNARNIAQLANELFKQGRFQAHTIEMEKAMKASDVVPPSWKRQLAIAYQKIKQDKKSKAVLQELVTDYPEDAAAWYLLANFELNEKKSEAAWKSLLHAFFINPFMEDLSDQVKILKEKNPQWSFKF